MQPLWIMVGCVVKVVIWLDVWDIAPLSCKDGIKQPLASKFTCTIVNISQSETVILIQTFKPKTWCEFCKFRYFEEKWWYTAVLVDNRVTLRSGKRNSYIIFFSQKTKVFAAKWQNCTLKIDSLMITTSVIYSLYVN